MLNLGCGIVMTLQEQKKGQEGESFDDSDDTGDDEGSSREGISTRCEAGAKQAVKSPVRKYLWLPARSLLVLSGPARYFWSHGIAPRTTDKVKRGTPSRNTLIV